MKIFVLCLSLALVGCNSAAVPVVTAGIANVFDWLGDDGEVRAQNSPQH